MLMCVCIRKREVPCFNRMCGEKETICEEREAVCNCDFSVASFLISVFARCFHYCPTPRVTV